jgi:CRP/FNR family transcriptional regulator, cyclic AMP receptor protein
LKVADIQELLASHPMFAGLETADLAFIAGCGRNVRLRAGSILFEEGGEADTFYVIRRGKVTIETHAPDRPVIVISTLGAGDVAGWSWLFPPYRWHFDGRVIEDTSAIALDGACIREACETDTGLGYRLMQRFARLAGERMQATRLQLLDLYGSPRREAPGERRAAG